MLKPNILFLKIYYDFADFAVSPDSQLVNNQSETCYYDRTMLCLNFSPYQVLLEST